MISKDYTITFLTPCFCAGADQSVAEIRPSAIRGQLRWWFRALGGFSVLHDVPLRQQETMIFGGAAGEEGIASPLIIRVVDRTTSGTKTGNDPDAQITAPTGYFLFPLRKQSRAYRHGSFELRVVWRGDSRLWDPIDQLVKLFANLGSLGFRSRRGYGALSMEGVFDLAKALQTFASGQEAITVFTLPECNDKDSALAALARWYKSWRTHGRTINGEAEGFGLPGFDYARNDHDVGYGINNRTTTYRPALGLPIIQRTQNGARNWNKNPTPSGEGDPGRFASPVLLRPHRAGQQQINPLVIFVDVYKWREGDGVYMQNVRKPVSPDLYNKMKIDRRLTLFNPSAP